MRMHSIPILSVLILISTALPSVAEEKTVVQSVNYPLYYFAGRLATDAFALHYLVDPEVDPAFWEPGDDAILAFQEADLILKNGADYEKWMKNVTMPTSSMVDTSKAFSSTFIRGKGEEHRHGDGTAHSHGGTVFTTWMDFSQAAVQAEAIAARFKMAHPASAEQIDGNLVSLKADLASLHATMKIFGQKWGDRPLAASHPIYQYLARAYGLKIQSLEWEPEMEMTEAAIEDLKKLRSRHKMEWMIWEDEPSRANVAAIAALGVKSVVFSPCANLPEDGDWLSVMKGNLGNFEALLK